MPTAQGYKIAAECAYYKKTQLPLIFSLVNFTFEFYLRTQCNQLQRKHSICLL